MDYAYDDLGRLTDVDDGHWPLAYRYDHQDRLIEEHQGWASFTYGYDARGTLAWSARYRAYGNLARLDIEHIAQPLRFQGQYHDPETGLHYNRHRYYHPETGSFITPDPIRLAGGLNSYRYAPNPIGWVDPLGLANVKGQCPEANAPLDKYYGSRKEAFKNAKRDAQIPTSYHPIEVKRVPLDSYGKQVINEHGVVQTREYHYLNLQKQRVVIQEHSYGHPEFSPSDASSKPHFNVREYDPITQNAKRTTILNLQSVANHYVFDRKQKTPKNY